MEKLLGQKEGNLKWNNNFESKSSRFNDFENEDFLSGKLYKEIIENNGTIRIVERFGRRTNQRKNGPNLDSDKMFLHSQYDKPEPFPRDYYEMAGILTDYQWIIISHKDTGKGDLRFLGSLILFSFRK